jgi:hypothetical protein
LSDEAFLYFTIILFVIAIIYWIGLLIYIFYDDIIDLLSHNQKNIIQEEPVYQPQLNKLRKPVK